MLVFSCSKNERWRSQCWIFRAYHLTHGYRISGQRTILPIIFRIRFIWAAISLWLSCVLHVSICSLAISILYNFYLGRVCSFEIYIFSLSPVVLTENVTIKRFFHSRRRWISAGDAKTCVTSRTTYTAFEWWEGPKSTVYIPRHCKRENVKPPRAEGTRWCAACWSRINHVSTSRR